MARSFRWKRCAWNRSAEPWAASAMFVEDERQSVEAIEKNLARTNLKGRVRQQDVFDFLRQRSNAEKFQIIFADPPYEKPHRGESDTEKLLNNESLPE